MEYSFNFLEKLKSQDINSVVFKQNQNVTKTIFNKNMNYYVCSFGGCGSTIIFNYLSNFGNVYHIHDRNPPKKLKYVGKTNTSEDVYSEWFNTIDIPESEINNNNYKVIYVYRNPLKVIYSRLAQKNGPNVTHLKHIMCDNNGNIHLSDVLRSKRDLYKLEEFYDNYSIRQERNYNIYCVKYEDFFNNISLFNKIIGLPDIKELYPAKHERHHKIHFEEQLTQIYKSLIEKMNKKQFIEVV